MSELSSLQEALEKVSLHRLIKAIEVIKQQQHQLPSQASIYILNNHTVDNLRWFLEGLGFAEGIEITYSQGEYDNIMQEILNPLSSIYQCNPEVIVLSLALENLVPDYLINNFSIDSVTVRIHEMVQLLSNKSSALIICNTFLSPLFNSEGSFSYKNPTSVENKIQAINSWLRQLCQRSERVYLVDWNYVEQKIGASHSRDYRLWYTASSLLTNKFLKEYAFEIIKLTKALKGKSKKVLLLDCDNTLWGGIIGEDGLDGIQIDPHNYPGHVFYDFQSSILKLIERGIIIGLCSKNNEEDVWDVMQNHPHCLLKRAHLSAWRINWENKADNIKSMAADMNLGMDSFVLVDDSPTECELIRQMHPQVTVLQVPKDLCSYPNILLENGLFDKLSVSQEDRNRTAMYQAEAKRKTESRQYTNIDDFLASIQLVAKIDTVSDTEIARVAQLTQKTNQFNLTTRRYSVANIETFVQDPNTEVFCLSVSDRFGNSGLTGVFIAKRSGNMATIDSFLLSCRILGRRLEEVFVDHCMSEIEKRWYVDSWTSEYIPTSKNKQVAEFWPLFGFTEIRNSDGKKLYQLPVSQRISASNIPITLITNSMVKKPGN